MTKRRTQQRQPDQGHPTTSRGEIVNIRYAADETGPAELLGGGLARIIDVPLLTEAFWQDDIVRLKPQGEGFPTIAEVVFTRFERRTRVQYFGGEFAGSLLLHLFRVLGLDCAFIVPPKDEGPGLISVAHPAGFRPEKVVKLLGADKPE
jgi:hypothetical protein